MMQPFQSRSWQDFLDSLGRFGVKLGLERMQALLSDLGQPQRNIPVIHVAGTNGKGSVCALVSHGLAAAGYRVGRYTSPHLVSWRERFWINGNLISEAEWILILGQLAQLIDTYPTQQERPTQFEVVTAAAWLYFQRHQVDCVVLEVGLGGRLDATNVGIDPRVTVITSIGWDHWQRLGSTLGQIAFEKMGICKPGVPLITGPQPDEVFEVIQSITQQRQAPLIQVQPAQRVSPEAILWQDQQWPLLLQGEVQLLNAALALTALQQLQLQGWMLSDEALSRGLQATQWPGRLQKLSIKDRTLIIDGAHNQPAAAALRHYVETQLQDDPTVTWSIGILTTKDVTGILKALLRPGDQVYTLPVSDHAGMDPVQLMELATQIQPDLALVQAFETTQDWYTHWLQTNHTSTQVLCGSLYLMGQVLQNCLQWEAAY